jgi:starvation-inducible DNA-binding protein
MQKLNLVFDSNQFAAAFRDAAGSPAAGTAAEGISCASLLLDELLALSIRLRNLYKHARRRAVELESDRLRVMFEEHYKGQLSVVDVLIDRLRMLGGAGRIMAGAMMQSTPLHGGLRGRQAIRLLLRELLDEHESVLSAAHQAETAAGRNDGSWVYDFAVGQVVLTNDLQTQSIRELLACAGDNPGPCRLAQP